MPSLARPYSQITAGVLSTVLLVLLHFTAPSACLSYPKGATTSHTPWTAAHVAERVCVAIGESITPLAMLQDQYQTAQILDKALTH